MKSAWIGAVGIAALLATAAATARPTATQAATQAATRAATRAATQAQPTPPRPTPAQMAAMPAAAVLPNTQALFDGYVRDGKMPGIVAAIGVADYPTIFPAAGKIADDATAAAAGPDSLWRIYSMTKPITGMAAMMLIEDGRIGLDDPLSRYIPAFANMRVLTSPDSSLDSIPAKTPITIRMLLTHTAGLAYNISAKGPLLKEYERLGILPGTVNTAIEAQARVVRPKSLADFANRVAQVPLIAEPGTKWHYSIGLDVLAAVIEKASGMPFERFLQTRLFTPLKMRSTGFTVAATDVARLSTNYAFVADNRVVLDPGATSVFLQPPSFPYGGAGLVSSARDYDRFLHMLLNGGTLDGVRVMKPASIALGMSNLLPPGVVFDGLGDGGGGAMSAKIGFGAGGSVYLEDMPNGGPAKGTYGWGGAAGTIGFVDPGRRIRGTIMVQYFPSEKWPLRRDVSVALARDAARFGHN